MCGILVYKNTGNSSFIEKRGLYNNETKINGYTFFHSLLPVTGEFTQQPFIDEDVVCIYNGEIYNHKFVKSDGENLIPLYNKHGITFARELDGEFAIAIYDFKNDLALFITDRFATKPLWVNGTECASYQSGVGGKEVTPNTAIVVQISTEREISRFNYHRWDWNQHKDTYDDWIKAFEEAVRKRATDRCFLGLSSGYDSGAISKELSRQGVHFKAFSIFNNENRAIIAERAKYCYEFEPMEATQRNDLLVNVEDIEYKSANEKSVKEDSASLGLATICRRASEEKRMVYLSGQGADEIIGDYKLYPNQSNFKGLFPEKLYRWNNFADGLQRDYIHKEEHIGGAYAIETRYPFLDTQVVQEFLWLKPELKNCNYKAPIYEYLAKNNVPFERGIKRGFEPLR